MQSKLGLVHIYCGEGKGKTTAAIGLAIRALGNGLKVVVVQFLKNGLSGEVKILQQFEQVKYLTNTELRSFSFNKNPAEKILCQKLHEENFQQAITLCTQGQCDLLLLDEIIGAINSDLFAEDRLLQWLKERPPNIEVVLTGRNPSPAMLAAADYISNIEKIRHPYDKNIPARFGIEK